MPDAPPEVASAPPSERFGKFVRVARLGAGGMGEVWKAWDTELGRWVALKFLRGSDPDEIARFKREAQVAAGLVHPNIAAVYDASDAFIAMQFIDGPTLAAARGRDPRTVAGWIRDAARALHFAHARGVIHRDLKPQNLMLDAAGRLFVLDFGLARTVREGSLTQSGMLLGTPAYMSPEQARGQPLDARSDVYSLGVALYELLEGHAPFAGSAAIDVLLQVQSRDPRPPERADRDLRTIVLACLEKEPARRYATAAALADDLDRWLRGEPVAARPVGSLARMVRRARRNPVAAFALVALLVLAVAGIAVLVRQRRAAAAAEERLTRLSTLWLNVAERKRDLRTGAVPPDRARAALDETARAIDRFIDENPAAPEGWYLRARARIYQERFDEAEADARRAIDCAPTASQPHELLAMVHLERALSSLVGVHDRPRAAMPQQQLIRKAADAFARASRCAPAGWAPAATSEDEVLRTEVAVLSRYVRDRDAAAADGALRAAMSRRRAEEYAMWRAWIQGQPIGREHLACFIEATECARGYTQAWLARGVTHRLLGERAAAIDCSTRALELDPRDPDIWVDRARARKESGDYDGAIADCDEALKIDARHSMAFANRGSARAGRGDRADALADYDAAIAIDPDNAPALHNRGALRTSTGDLDGALEDFDRAIATGDLHAETYVGRALVRHLRRDYEGALADYASALQLDPRDGRTYSNRGVTRQAMGDRDGAVREYTQAIDINPRDKDALNNRGVVLQELGKIPEAIRDYTAAIGIDGRWVLPRHARGTARTAAGDIDGALEDFTEAIRIDPRHAKSYVTRAAIRRSRGDPAGAIADLEKALEVAPADWPMREGVRRALRDLRGP